MNLNNSTTSGRRLTEAELDANLRARAQALNGYSVPRIPLGCDQQGRHPEAAEACTELGDDDDGRRPHSTGTTIGLILIGIGVLLWCVLAVHLIARAFAG